MSVIIQGNQLRDVALGRRAEKASGTLSAAAIPVFTVAGGEVLITSLYLRVTTSITGAGTVALQQNPTTGDTTVAVAATDLGTTDTLAGTTVGVGYVGAADAAAIPVQFVRGGPAFTGWPVTTGQVELLGASAINGAVTVVATWIPLSDGATLVAA